jgi:putative FmdB family regulatory protein
VAESDIIATGTLGYYVLWKYLGRTIPHGKSLGMDNDRTPQRSRRFAPGMPGMPMEESSAAMPTYEYVCQSCGARFEAWQKITDDPIDVCPTCGEHVRRIIFPVGLVFKGSGFYINDTRSHTPPADAHSGSEPAAKESSASGETSGTNSADSGHGKEATSTAAGTSSSSDSSSTSGKAKVSDTTSSSAPRPASGD